MSTAVPLGAFADAGGPQVAIPYAGQSSRLTTFFRSWLVVPHYFMMFFVGIGALFASLCCYLSVLFLGRPAFAGFLTGALRYFARVQAYAWFLTDVYPPFSLGEGGYVVEVAFDVPERVGRWRFFFTYLVLLPQVLALYLVLIGGFICTFIAWWAIMFTGRYPEGLFNFTAGAVRWQTRVSAYLYLLSNQYPPFTLD
jgi:hypothetical protein